MYKWKGQKKNEETIHRMPHDDFGRRTHRLRHDRKSSRSAGIL